MRNAETVMYLNKYACRLIKLETTSSQKSSCQTHKFCVPGLLTVSSNYFTKIHDYSMVIQAFSMHGMFCHDFPGFPWFLELVGTLTWKKCKSSLPIDVSILIMKLLHWSDWNFKKFMKAFIGVAPITQVKHMRNKNSNIQGRSLNVIKVIFHTKRNCS